MKTLPRTTKRSTLPPEFRDSPILRSRKGRLGRITVNRYTGVVKNSAARTVQQLEKNLGGDKETIASLLEAYTPLSKAEVYLLELLRDPEKRDHSLARLMAEAKCDPAQVIKKISGGALELGKAAAYIQIGVAMPQVVRELRRHIQPKSEICLTCQGKGMVPKGVTNTIETQICPSCKGEKGTLVNSEKMEFAVDKLIEMSKMGKQPSQTPLVAVQNNTTNIEGGSMAGLMERVVTATNSLLFAKKDAPLLPQGEASTTDDSSSAAIEAEVLDVPSPDSSSEPTEG